MNNIGCEECGELADLRVNYGGVDNTEHFCRNCYNNVLRDIIRRYENKHIADLLWALKCVMENIDSINY